MKRTMIALCPLLCLGINVAFASHEVEFKTLKQAHQYCPTQHSLEFIPSAATSGIFFGINKKHNNFFSIQTPDPVNLQHPKPSLTKDLAGDYGIKIKNHIECSYQYVNTKGVVQSINIKTY